VSGADLYWPFFTLGFCVVWLRILESGVRFAGFRSRSLKSLVREGRGSVVNSCLLVLEGLGIRRVPQWLRYSNPMWARDLSHTSNDCAYQSRTRSIEGISFNPSGRSSNSCTRCANRMGNSSDRNCDARKRVPTAQLSQNWPTSLAHTRSTYRLMASPQTAPSVAVTRR
jgi:hypothetical protein